MGALCTPPVCLILYWPIWSSFPKLFQLENLLKNHIWKCNMKQRHSGRDWGESYMGRVLSHCLDRGWRRLKECVTLWQRLPAISRRGACKPAWAAVIKQAASAFAQPEIIHNSLSLINKITHSSFLMCTDRKHCSKISRYSKLWLLCVKQPPNHSSGIKKDIFWVHDE